MSRVQRISNPAVGLDSLPLPALSLIFQNCSSATRRSLLQVSRLSRDIVLCDSRSVNLKLTASDTPAACKPLARLLDRVCSNRSERLTVVLDATEALQKSAQRLLLSRLLHHGLVQRGWQSVKEVTAKGFKCSTPLIMLAAAFPALERLTVVGIPLSCTDLEHLAACTQLTCLELTSCHLTDDTATSQGTNPSPLAAVTTIRQLKLSAVSSAIASGLTQLTSLHFESRHISVVNCMNSISGMHNLQQLRVLSATSDWLTADKVPLLQQLVTTAVQLRVLQLPRACDLGQQEVDLLLTHAPHLTHLSCYSVHLTEKRSHSACSWSELETRDARFYQLAYLPLQSVRRLTWGDFELPSSCPCVEITVYDGQSDPEERLEYLTDTKDAITNLGRCPAWQLSGSAVKCLLEEDEDADEDEELDCDQALAETVAALSGLASKQLELSIKTGAASFCASLVEQFGRALGSSLTALDLQSGSISRDFWPAVWAHLPGLQHLRLGWHIDKDTIHHNDLAAFCTHAARPLQLSLQANFEDKVGPADELRELGRIWGGPQVTIAIQPC